MGGCGFDPGPHHTKDVKNGTSGYLAWRSAFIRQVLASLLSLKKKKKKKGAWWRSGRASDSESRGPMFNPHKPHRVVSLSKTH